MAHYAMIDNDNKVTGIIVGKDEHEPLPEGYASWEQYYGGLRTSYNTFAGVHQSGGTPYRKNMAAIGYTYDANRDAFIPPQPFVSWTLNENTCRWEAPVPIPSHTADEKCEWIEVKQEWQISPIN